MSFFDKLLGRDNSKDLNNKNIRHEHIDVPNEQVESNKKSNTLNLSKEEAIKTLNLRKSNLNTLCLKKKELSNVIARVCVVMDYSYSMEGLYDRGVVQTLFERLLPIAIKFDDNGELESWIFSNSFERLESITEDNFYGYVNREIRRYRMGGTEYTPVMRDVVKKYVKEEPSNVPTYVIFITDGDNSDKKETDKVIIESSKNNIFWQFVGIGDNNFNYLMKLDEMDGRYVDNANFFKCNNINKVSDNELYEKLLAEFPEWIEKAKNLGIIK